MSLPFASAGIDVTYYPVTHSSEGVKQSITAALNCDLILVMGYFGMSDAPSIPSSYKGVVIEDLTHSLFSSCRCNRADYTFGSLRKWCGVWTGGFAWKRDHAVFDVAPAPANQHYVATRKHAMEEKSAYISSGEGGKNYLVSFNNAEEWLDGHASVMQADVRDVLLAHQIDAESIRGARRSNAEVLLSNLDSSPCVKPVFSELDAGDCPLFVPVLLEQRDSLRRYLIEHEVYCPVHWPVSAMHVLDDETSVFYKQGLSLVCDQRYGADGMLRICDLVKEWQKIS